MSLEETNPLWEIMVPCQFNDGVPVRTRHHKAWDAKVMRISGGQTIYQPGKGRWEDEHGTVYEERMIPVRIMCSETDIEKIADITMVHYEQVAVMYYRVSDHCVIRHATNPMRARFRRENTQ